MTNTYRDILKWGDKREEALNEATLKVITEEFGFTETYFSQPFPKGNRPVALVKKSSLSYDKIDFLTSICGAENVLTDDFSRAAHAYGKHYTDLLNLREGRVSSPPDAVVSPRTTEEVEKLVAWASLHRIPLIPFGGSSSVTRGLEATHGGIAVDLTLHLNRVVEVNESDLTVTVQAGMYGPAFEVHLNGVGKGYTCGHFPQSFEHSTVGGWVVTKGAGQASTGYGKIEDMVLSLTVVTPRGTIRTKPFPRSAQGWDLNQVFMGSEGTLGIVTEVTIRIRRIVKGSTRYAGFVFRNFEAGVAAMMEVMQGQVGYPHLFRISDPQETEIAFKTKGFEGSFADRLLTLLGYKGGDRCLMFMSVEGDEDYTNLVKSKVKRIARSKGGFPLGASPVVHWLKQRYSSAYLRDPLMDIGIRTDTLETAVLWTNLLKVWSSAHAYSKSFEKTLLMVHISHCYENGANLYFTFLAPMNRENEIESYMNFHKGLLDTITQNGGSISHHHGVGRAMAPWMVKMHGEVAMGLNNAIKSYLDPNSIMNPGSMLGLES